MTETAKHGPRVTHQAGFCSSTSDMVDQVVVRTRQAKARGQHMIALLNAEVRVASASRMGSTAASGVDFRPQEWLATKSASAIIASCEGGSAGSGTGMPLAVLAQSPPATRAGDGATWHHSDRQFVAALAGRPVHLLCLFDAVAGPAAELHVARVSHPFILVDGEDCPNPDFRPYDEVFPPYHLSSIDELGRPDAIAAFGPFEPSEVKLWLRAQGLEPFIPGGLVDDLALVVTEAVTTSWETRGDIGARPSDPSDAVVEVPLVRVRLWRGGSTVTCDIETRSALASLSPLIPPADRRLSMLWFAEKISPQINVAIHDAPSSHASRIRVRAHHG